MDAESVEARNGSGTNAQEGRVRSFARGIMRAIQTQIQNSRGVWSRDSDSREMQREEFENAFTSLGFDVPRGIDE